MLNLKQWLRHLPTLLLIFTGDEKCKIWSRFSTTVTFDALSWGNWAKYLKNKICTGSADDCPMYNATTLFSSVHPTLITERWDIVPWIKEPVKFTESSITRLRYARLCRNLMRQCIMGRCRSLNCLNTLPVKSKMADSPQIFNVWIAVTQRRLLDWSREIPPTFRREGVEPVRPYNTLT